MVANRTTKLARLFGVVMSIEEAGLPLVGLGEVVVVLNATSGNPTTLILSI